MADMGNDNTFGYIFLFVSITLIIILYYIWLMELEGRIEDLEQNQIQPAASSWSATPAPVKE